MNKVKEQECLLRTLLRNNLSSFIETVYNSVDNAQPYIHSKHIELIADRFGTVLGRNNKKIDDQYAAEEFEINL